MTYIVGAKESESSILSEGYNGHYDNGEKRMKCENIRCIECKNFIVISEMCAMNVITNYILINSPNLQPSHYYNLYINVKMK